MLFLWNAISSKTSHEIKLQFYDSSKRKVRDLAVTDYAPYFLTHHPLEKHEKESIATIQGKTEIIERRNLFKDKLLQLTKVKAWTPALLEKLKGFRNVWENEIEYSRSYVYDSGLIFGAPYAREGDRFVMVRNAEHVPKQEFVKAFADTRRTAPQKHKQITSWFQLCHQPIPDIDPELLDLKKEKRSIAEQVYVAFLLARIANIPLPEAATSRRVSDWIKSVIYTHLRNTNCLIPTSEELRRGLPTHRVPGALTIDPEAGTYFNTIVCDFESLYPSCIDSFNLSYETVDCPHAECKTNRISETEHHVCTKRRGFYSVLIGALKDLRIHWFKPRAGDTSLTEHERKRATLASNLLKLISVSSYGVTVRIHGVACPPLAESITAYGRWALQTTWDAAERNSLHPIYGDTDSIFLDSPTKSQVQTLIDFVRRSLNLDLAIEKRYLLCVLPAAKKAYFGILEGGNPELKGLTAIKSNAPNFIKQVFRDCVEALSHVKNMDEYILAKEEVLAIAHGAMKKLQERKVDLSDLVYSVQLYHDPKERVESATLPQPYQCAVQLIDAGETLRRRDTVQFVKVTPFNYRGRTFTVRPAGHVKSSAEINVRDYVRNLRTALEQVFEPMNIKLELERDAKLTHWFGT